MHDSPRPGRGLADLSIRNPVFAVKLAAAMLVFGYRDGGISRFPEVDFPVVSIVITLEGASPDVMDGDVADVIEDAGVKGVDSVAAQSHPGVSQVNIFFRLDRDIDVAMPDVQNGASAARRKLPREIEQPVILKLNPNNPPVVGITPSSSSVSHGKICDFAEKEFKQAIAATQDVCGVQFSGPRTRNVRIWLDTRTMWSYNLTALLALPFAATGTLVTPYLTGDTLNMMSLIGMILLMGLVKRISIILVDAANRQRAAGLDPTAAVVNAGRERLRPILMTSLACVAGAIPAAIGRGPRRGRRWPAASSAASYSACS